MLVPLNWLKEYVDIDENMDVKDIVEKFTMSGSKVENIEVLGQGISDVVIGRIVEIKKHPAADKLVICLVDVKDELLQIVTGATNVYVGAYVPVAKVGATLPGGVKIRKQKLRGEESLGMLCSAEELGIDEQLVSAESRGGIYILPELPLGMDVKQALGLNDIVIDFELTHNRSDCMSMVGMAREAAAVFNKKLDYPAIDVKEVEEKVEDYADVEIAADDLCPRYVARVVKNIKITPSPLWMQQRLIKAGMRPVNNIVDVTNYVMLELGQPLHAFDLDKVKGRRIIVRRAQKGEFIETIDHRTRELDETMLVIADIERPVAIAGIMGGLNTEITDETTTILIESATFNGSNVRLTSRKLGLRSEASSRFERGLDPNLALDAVNRAAQLIEEIGAGEVLKGTIDVYKKPVKPWRVAVRPHRVNSLLGTEIDTAYMADLLERLGLKCLIKEDTIEVEVPTFRQDLRIEADIVEEVARLYGYDNIQETLLDNCKASVGLKTYEQKMEDMTRDIMGACGLNEVVTYSFESPKAFDNILLREDDPRRKAIQIANPLGEEYSVMRTTMIPSMLDVLSLNLNRRVERAAAYEIGRVYLPEELPLKKLPVEVRMLSIGIYGDGADFYDIKGIVETYLNACSIKAQFKPAADPTFHPGRAAEIFIEGKRAGVIGEIHPDVAEIYNMNKRVYVGEINLDVVFKKANMVKTYRPLPKFPAVTRDLAVIVPDDVAVGDLEGAIERAGGELIERIKLFDVYKGDPVPEGHKSVAFSLIFRSKEKTLVDQEVNEVFDKIVQELNKGFGARLR
ncbi:phenylalanine--tRNA ligase subunit beta [Caldanaerobius polysaccharolyticus]|uniref:phenylalanine--tRNA ligase subunit beta n=1 Tax=Caldanaerobius polysaccharolyticus TaxID=44256 RepID=UPI00047C5723|nr:phenylalanine--tRNA ligase subunit beta [Caldanaerobius polysaccharolyticus]